MTAELIRNRTALLCLFLIISVALLPNHFIFADSLPLDAIVTGTSSVPDEYTGKEFTNPGPQSWNVPDPQSLVNSIWISSATNVQSPVLYFDVAGTTYQATISGSPHMLIVFASPTSVSNVQVHIAGRLSPSDGIGVGYVYDNPPIASPPGVVSPLPSGTTMFTGTHDDELHSWTYRLPGPQIHSYPNPPAPVYAIYTSVTTYVSDAYLYFDANGNTHSIQVFPNSNIVLNFASPTIISNVKIAISGRGYPDDGGNVSYYTDGPPPQSGSGNPSQPTQTTGQLTIQGTCGIGSLTPLNYGTLTPFQPSLEQTLTITNTGTVPGQLFVQGLDWESAPFVSQIAVGNTYFGTTSTPGVGPTMPAPPTAGFESSLDYAYQPITPASGFAVGPNNTFWQVVANLLNPSFVGTLTQEYNFTASC